jgi:hypothetical protein
LQKAVAARCDEAPSKGSSDGSGSAFFVTADPVVEVNVKRDVVNATLQSKSESRSISVGSDEPMSYLNEIVQQPADRPPIPGDAVAETEAPRVGSSSSSESGSGSGSTQRPTGKSGFEEFVELKKENRMLKLQIARMQAEGNKMYRGTGAGSGAGAGAGASASAVVGLTSGKTSRW